MRKLALAALLLTAPSATACTGSVQRGSSLYEDGRYVEAAEVFERNEHRLSATTPRERAGYGLYRGLTLLVLGDYGGAQHWLSFAHDVDRAHPGALRHDRRALLERAWSELNQRLRELEGSGARDGNRVAEGVAAPAPASGAEPVPAERALVPHR